MQINQFQNSQLKEFYLKAKMDIELIETNILMNKEKYDGCESSSTEQSLLNQISTYAKETYNVEVSADIAGMEGLVDKLKEGFKRVGEMLKSKPNKSKLAIVKSDGYQAKSAVKIYESEGWLKDQTFINIGNTKFQTPSIFEDIKSVDDVKKIIQSIVKQCENTFNNEIRDVQKRLSTGLGIFNKYKSKEWDEELFTELEKQLPIKPEIKVLDKDKILSLIGTGYVHNSIPVLTKDKVKEVTKLMLELADISFKIEEEWLKLSEGMLDTSDFWDSGFWDNVPDKTLIKLWESVEWHYVNDVVYDPMYKVLSKVILELAKFLENWILYSVK